MFGFVGGVVVVWRVEREVLGWIFTVVLVLISSCAAERMKALPSSLKARTNCET